MNNVLFIMCDQLRWDYLSCYGHPYLKTPNIDWLADEGVRFTKAFVQSTICGPSRMSAYTGRYMRSHGSTSNGVPLRVGEPTLGDHLNEIGVRSVLVGKTHMTADAEGLDRLGIAPDSIIGVHVSECGFEPFERDDGMRVRSTPPFHHAYDRYLRQKGYDSDSPWHDWANSAGDSEGRPASGWFNENAGRPARVAEEDSETPYMTRRAMEFMTEAKTDGRPWCLHLSYIKPHWPYIVPAPYNSMYGPGSVKPVQRSESERAEAHPIFKAFIDERFSRLFSEEVKRQTVIGAYMGLIKQIDDQLGLLFQFMRDEGLLENTMIVFTSDHGDYLGDHWLGEKYLFHDASVRVPLIIRDPDSASASTRGTVNDQLVEMIDLAPTFLSYFGGSSKPHVLEGHSLMPLLHGAPLEKWRRFAFSEYDYAYDLARVKLNVPVEDSKLYMVTDGRWKYIHADGFSPMLYDLKSDPQEFCDLGQAPETAELRLSFERELGRWMRRAQMRITADHGSITETDEAFSNYDILINPHVLIGYWDEAELEEERRKRDAFKAARNPT